MQRSAFNSRGDGMSLANVRTLMLKSYRHGSVIQSEFVSDANTISRIRLCLETYDDSKAFLLLNQFVVVYRQFNHKDVPVILEARMADSVHLPRLYAALFAMGMDIGLTINDIDIHFYHVIKSVIERNFSYEEIFSNIARQM